MENKNYLTPKEIADFTISAVEKKVSLSPVKVFILAIMAGMFIAFSAAGSNTAAFNLLANPSTFGVGKALAGAVFGAGLLMVLLAGAELFTGNSLIIMGVLEKKVGLGQMLTNWVTVFIGNFIGAMLVVLMNQGAGLWATGSNELAAITIKIAAGKTGLSFIQAILLGIMCNMLVCLAVWMSYAATNVIGKVFAVFFPIWLFVCSGFEHSIANMYYIPAGILAKSNPDMLEAAINLGVTEGQVSGLTWKNFFIGNLLPVTLGNIIGGLVFVGLAYWFVYKYKEK